MKPWDEDEWLGALARGDGIGGSSREAQAVRKYFVASDESDPLNEADARARQIRMMNYLRAKGAFSGETSGKQAAAKSAEVKSGLFGSVFRSIFPAGQPIPRGAWVALAIVAVVTPVAIRMMPFSGSGTPESTDDGMRSAPIRNETSHPAGTPQFDRDSEMRARRLEAAPNAPVAASRVQRIELDHPDDVVAALAKELSGIGVTPNIQKRSDGVIRVEAHIPQQHRASLAPDLASIGADIPADGNIVLEVGPRRP